MKNTNFKMSLPNVYLLMFSLNLFTPDLPVPKWEDLRHNSVRNTTGPIVHGGQ